MNQELARSLWAPVRVPVFRNLLIANVLSDIGTFMQSLAAAWLMVSFGAGPLYVALTQTASSLPFFVLALPAGVVGDIVDRRRLLLFTEVWMVAVATLLAGLTAAGVITPWLLLPFTFAISTRPFSTSSASITSGSRSSTRDSTRNSRACCPRASCAKCFPRQRAES